MEKYDAMKPTNVRVTVLEDPNNSLHELFNPSPQNQSLPWRERHLPRSFFVPPTESTDSSRINRTSNPRTTGFVISHNKANSSPASLDPGLDSAFSISNIHVHQKSLDVGGKYPYGFVHNPEIDNVYGSGFLHANSNTNATPYVTRVELPDAICDLPDGYEMTIDEENKVYFLNHRTQATTWFDPRIPNDYQEWGMTLEQLREVHINYAKQRACSTLNANVGMQIPPQVERISPGLLPPSGVCPNPTSPGLRGQQLPLPSSSSPSNVTVSAASPANGGVGEPSSSSTTSCAVDPTSPSRSLTAGTPGAAASGRMHVNSGNLPPAHHPREPPTDSQQQMHQHQRQHSHGHSEPQMAVAQTFGSHFRSCSQPVPMSTGCSSVITGNTGGLPHNPVVVSQSRSSSNGNATPSHLGALATGSMVGGIGIGIASAAGGHHVLPSGHLSQHQQPQQASAPPASSGQLVQGLEELRLNNPASTLLLEQQHQQQNNSKHHKTPRGHYILSPAAPTVGQQTTSIPRFVNPTNTAVAAAQHSHQGSMDSGVGQSTASANQTPEHGVMVFYDPEEGTTQHMEGITFTADELNCTNYSLFDTIDISQIGS